MDNLEILKRKVPVNFIAKDVCMHKESNVLEFCFPNMSIGKDKEFILEVINLLEYVENLQPPYLLINAAKSEYMFNQTLVNWMENVVYHHMIRAGVKKIAIITNEKLINQESRPLDSNKIKQALFLDKEIAIRWLKK